jgi:hypothetical protein
MSTARHSTGPTITADVKMVFSVFFDTLSVLPQHADGGGDYADAKYQVDFKRGKKIEGASAAEAFRERATELRFNYHNKFLSTLQPSPSGKSYKPKLFFVRVAATGADGAKRGAAIEMTIDLAQYVANQRMPLRKFVGVGHENGFRLFFAVSGMTEAAAKVDRARQAQTMAANPGSPSPLRRQLETAETTTITQDGEEAEADAEDDAAAAADGNIAPSESRMYPMDGEADEEDDADLDVDYDNYDEEDGELDAAAAEPAAEPRVKWRDRYRVAGSEEPAADASGEARATVDTDDEAADDDAAAGGDLAIVVSLGAMAEGNQRSSARASQGADGQAPIALEGEEDGVMSTQVEDGDVWTIEQHLVKEQNDWQAEIAVVIAKLAKALNSEHLAEHAEGRVEALAAVTDALRRFSTLDNPSLHHATTVSPPFFPLILLVHDLVATICTAEDAERGDISPVHRGTWLQSLTELLNFVLQRFFPDDAGQVFALAQRRFSLRQKQKQPAVKQYTDGELKSKKDQKEQKKIDRLRAGLEKKEAKKQKKVESQRKRLKKKEDAEAQAAADRAAASPPKKRNWFFNRNKGASGEAPAPSKKDQKARDEAQRKLDEHAAVVEAAERQLYEKQQQNDGTNPNLVRSRGSVFRNSVTLNLAMKTLTGHRYYHAVPASVLPISPAPASTFLLDDAHPDVSLAAASSPLWDLLRSTALESYDAASTEEDRRAACVGVIDTALALLAIKLDDALHGIVTTCLTPFLHRNQFIQSVAFSALADEGQPLLDALLHQLDSLMETLAAPEVEGSPQGSPDTSPERGGADGLFAPALSMMVKTDVAKLALEQIVVAVLNENHKRLLIANKTLLGTQTATSPGIRNADDALRLKRSVTAVEAWASTHGIAAPVAVVLLPLRQLCDAILLPSEVFADEEIRAEVLGALPRGMLHNLFKAFEPADYEQPDDVQLGADARADLVNAVYFWDPREAIQLESSWKAKFGKNYKASQAEQLALHTSSGFVVPRDDNNFSFFDLLTTPSALYGSDEAAAERQMLMTDKERAVEVTSARLATMALDSGDAHDVAAVSAQLEPMAVGACWDSVTRQPESMKKFAGLTLEEQEDALFQEMEEADAGTSPALGFDADENDAAVAVAFVAAAVDHELVQQDRQDACEAAARALEMFGY